MKNVKVTRTKGKVSTITLTLRFNDSEDPEKAARIYGAVGAALGQILTPEEREDFLRQMDAARASLKKPKKKAAR